MEPFFSVIMPVYRTENYLKSAAQSVLEQTFSDFELLLIDDFSPDMCGAICDALEGSDVRVRVVHLKKNEGLSGARNAGLTLARGRYVCFMDSDDTIDKTLLESLYNSLKNAPAQAVMFGMCEEYYDKFGRLKSTHEVIYREVNLRDENLRREIILIEQASLYGYACNKAYELAFIKEKGLTFKNVKLIEDIRFNVDFFMDAQSLNCLKTAPYHYKKRGGESLTAKFAPDYYALHMERVRLLKSQYESWGMYDENVKQVLGAVYARFILSALERNCDKRANRSLQARKSFVKELITDELYRELMPYAKPEGRLARAALRVLKSKNEAAILLLGRTVHTVSSSLPFLFARAKQSR
ncbi:MAG TPA: glycosyltransferase family 2 protein [Clostridia bacterium]|nr:glycosyltransferase family 2 protein [Clostridia bacterium]